MKQGRRLLARVALSVLVAVGALFVPGIAAADVNDFSYESWRSDYEVTLSDEGRSLAHVTEMLVARFPEYDQNRGIIRGLPTRFRGADLNVTVLSITDERGAPVHYTTERESGELLLLLGTDDFVHGLTTYVIEYSMQDVMITGGDLGNDEFYWNILPLDSSQAIEHFEANVTFAPELAAALTGDWSCYQGYAGSSAPCAVNAVDTLPDGSARFTLASGHRGAGDGVTLAVGFTEGTIAQPFARQVNNVAPGTAAAAAGAAVVSTFAAAFAAARTRRKARVPLGEVGVPWAVPGALPPLLAQKLVPRTRSVVAAQIVHLAVSWALRIEDPAEKADPVLHLLDPAKAADPLDKRMLQELFQGETSLTMEKHDTLLAERMRLLDAEVSAVAIERGLLEKRRSPAARTISRISLVFVLIAVGTAIFGAIAGGNAASEVLWFSVIIGVFAWVWSMISGRKLTVHTPAGAAAAAQLEGLRAFIGAADTERLQMFQSATGAERYREGGMQVVHLYERLLPYAILFGQEKSWGKVLDVAYETAHYRAEWIDTDPARGMSTTMRSFTRSVGASASSPSDSSGGGSSGGGSSGGGGGGGSSGGR